MAVDGEDCHDTVGQSQGTRKTRRGPSIQYRGPGLPGQEIHKSVLLGAPLKNFPQPWTMGSWEEVRTLTA